MYITCQLKENNNLDIMNSTIILKTKNLPISSER